MGAHPAHHDHLDLAALDDRRRRALWIALVANGAFLVVQLAGAIAFGSLALFADTAHMAADVGALAIALVAFTLARRPASPRHTYGLLRGEVLAGQLNALLLLAAATWIAVAALGRIGDEPDIDGVGVAAVAFVGLLVNAGSAWVLARAAPGPGPGRRGNVNLRGAFWHLATDALGSLGAIVAGLAVVVWDATWVDLAVALVLAALVVVAALRLLRETTEVLVDAVPAGLDVEEVAAAMAAEPGVEAVHHLHVWSLGADIAALSAHLSLAGDPTLHEAQEIADRVKTALAREYGVAHATIEVECHPCEPEPALLHDRPHRPALPERP